MIDIATALGAVTVDSLIEQALQGGLWGVLVALITWGARSLWAFYKPHINDALKAKLKRYEATTKLTEGLQQTQSSIAEQQRQIVELLKINTQDGRLYRKWIRRVAELMEDHLCMANTDVRKRIFDSDDLDESSDSGDKPSNPNTR